MTEEVLRNLEKSLLVKDLAKANFYRIAIPTLRQNLSYLRKAVTHCWESDRKELRLLSLTIIDNLRFQAELLQIPLATPNKLIDINGRSEQVVITEAIADAEKILGADGTGNPGPGQDIESNGAGNGEVEILESIEPSPPLPPSAKFS